MILRLGLLSMLGVVPRWRGNWQWYHLRHSRPKSCRRRRGAPEVEENFRHWVALVEWQWGLRIAILGLLVVVALLLEFEVFGVEVTRFGMIRSRGCAVQ